MPLSGKERRALASQANRMKPTVTIAGGEVSENTAEHIRTALSTHALLRIRVTTDDRREFAVTLEQLAERVPCEVVHKVGRTALLHRGDAGEAGV